MNMKNNLKKIQKLSVFLILAIFFIFGYAQKVSAQAVSNFGVITDYANKQVIENPANVVGDPSQILSSSCPDGSVLVGFNLYNQGDSYSRLGSLYCRTVELNLGGSAIYTKLLIENPFGGNANSSQINNSSCPSGFVATGFNILNAGANTSSEGILYCKQVLSAKVSSTGQSQTVSIGYQTTVRKDVIQNPFGGGANMTQMLSSSCPDGYVITGFNLVNMGSNFDYMNDLYCSKLTFTLNPLEFDFSISGDGHRYIYPGDTVSNALFVNSVVSNVSGDVKLTIDSIKNSNGVSVMNATNGFTVSSNPFSPKTNIVTLSPTIKQVTVPLSFVSNPSILPETYTVNISGVYTKTVAGTSGSTTNYYCKIEFKSDDKGYYFGCNTTSNFSPKDDFIASGNSSNPSAIECINRDTFGPGADAICFDNNKVLSVLAKEQISDFRLSYGDAICPGVVNVVGDQNNPNTGFTCVVAPVAPVTQTINKTTTFDVIVQQPAAAINYDLSLTPSPDGCPASSLFVTAMWKAVPNASSYNLYRLVPIEGSRPLQYAVNQNISVTNANLVNGYLRYQDYTFPDYNQLIAYKVSAVVNGSEITASKIVTVFTPKITTNCIPPVTPVLKLFTKKTTDTTTNLSTIDVNTAITTANTEISIYKNEAFDLKWVSNLGVNYTCSQVTVLPNGTTNNSRIVYGNTTNGTSIGIAGSNLDTGTNLLKVSCTNGVAVLSNVVRITVLFEPTYNFSVISSGDQCQNSNVWIKQTWSAVPNASSYKIARTGGTGPVNYTIASPTLLNTENYNVFNSTTATLYTYVITAVIGGVDQTPSAPITILSPRTGINCPQTPVLKLFTKKSSDTSINLSNYDTSTVINTTNTEISLNRNESFDLKWVSNLDASYTCTQDTQIPGGSTNNNIWPYGNSRSGAAVDLRATGQSIGLYNLKISCTNGTSVLSNVVKITILPDPIVYNLSVISSGDQCLSSDVWIRQTWSAVSGATSYKITRTGGTGPVTYTISSPTLTNTEPYTAFSSTPTSYIYTVSAVVGGVEQQASDPITIISPKIACPVGTPAIKIFIRKSSDTSVNITSFNILSAFNTSNTSASVKMGQDSFDLKWVSNLGTGYTCNQVTTRPDGSSGNGLWSYGSYINGATYGLVTSGYLAGAYTFSVSCSNGATTVVSNIVDLTIIDPLNYKLNVITSGDQCLTSDVWTKQLWSIISNASSYKITRTGGSGTVTYNVPATPTQNTELFGSFSGTPTAYTYTISAIVGGIEQTTSAPITITSPKQYCLIIPVIKLFTRKSTDSTVNFSTYTAATALIPQNSDIVVTKGQEYFDLKWMSNLDNSYVCTQVTTTPAGTTNNALWSYGSYPNGTVYWQGTGSVATGVYGFKVSCTKGASTVESNTVNVNIVNPINYNFVVAPSANQCDINNLQIRLTWSLIPGATSYRITRTQVSTGQTSNYAVSSGIFTQSLANGTNAFVQDVDYTYKVVAVANGVAIAPSSPTVTVKSPKQDAILCSTLSLKLEVKKSTDSTASYSSAITVNKGENFDIRWTIVNPNGSVYMNSNSVVGPQGINGNGLWAWGSGSSGSRTGLSTTPQAVVAGDYIFKIDMMDTSTGNYVLALSSNSAKVTINSITDVCPNLPGIQTVVPDGMIKNSAGDCVPDGGGGGGFDPDIKLFIGDTSVKTYDLSNSIPTIPYARDKGQNFTLKWITNLPSGFECEAQTTSLSSPRVTIWDWNQSNLTTGDNDLQTVSVTPDTYNFQLYCVDPINSPNQVRRGNVAQMALSDITIDPNSIRLFIGGANILSNTLATPINPNATYKIKKGNRFNLLWASNLNNSYECTANTKKSDGTEFTTWDWNTNKSKGDKTTNLTTGNVEKGIYSFQLFCTDPAHDPGNPDKQSNIVKLQVVESTIIEQ
jgi:hypothetical protein